jgi:hypothetical protein
MNPSAVLATIGQAYEQKLMEPIFNLAKEAIHTDTRGYKTARFQIMGWLHDGAFVHVQDKKSISWYLNKLLKSWDLLSTELDISISIALAYKSKKMIINPSITQSVSSNEIQDFIITASKVLESQTLP